MTFINIKNFEISYSREHLEVDPKKIKYILIEGVFVFCNEKLKDLCHFKIWVDTNEYICGLRRFLKYTRDIQGYTPEFVLTQCTKFVVPGIFLILIIFSNKFSLTKKKFWRPRKICQTK